MTAIIIGIGLLVFTIYALLRSFLDMFNAQDDWYDDDEEYISNEVLQHPSNFTDHR